MRILTSIHTRLRQLAYSWDGGFLFAVSDDDRQQDRGIDRWNLTVDCLPQSIMEDGFSPDQIAALPDGRLLVSGKGIYSLERGRMSGVLVIDPQGERPVEAPRRFANSVSFAVSPTGDRFVIRDGGRRGFGGATLLSYPFPLGQALKQEWNLALTPLRGGQYATLGGFALDCSGQRLLTLERTSFRGAGEELIGGFVCLTDRREERSTALVGQWRSASTGKALGKPIPLPGVFTGDPLLAANGTRLICWKHRSLYSLDLTNPNEKPTKAVSASENHFADLVVHPNGRWLLTTSNDDAVRVYDTCTLQELRAYAWNVGNLRCVAIAPDGLTAAVGSDTGRVVVWDLE